MFIIQVWQVEVGVYVHLDFCSKVLVSGNDKTVGDWCEVEVKGEISS